MSSAEERPDDHPRTDDPQVEASQDDPSESPHSESPSSESGGSWSLPPVPPTGTAAPPQREHAFGHPSSTTTGPDSDDDGSSGPAGAGSRDSSPPSGTNSAEDTSAVSDHRDGSPPHAQTTPSSSDGRTSGAGSTTTSAGGGPPISEEDQRALTQRSRLAVVLGVGAVVFSVPLFPVGLGLGLAAIVLGVLTSRRARQAGTTVSGTTPSIVLGIVASVLAIVVATILLTFFDEVTAWQDCLSAANTLTGEEICNNEFQQQLDERLGRWSG